MLTGVISRKFLYRAKLYQALCMSIENSVVFSLAAVKFNKYIMDIFIQVVSSSILGRKDVVPARIYISISTSSDYFCQFLLYVEIWHFACLITTRNNRWCRCWRQHILIFNLVHSKPIWDHTFIILAYQFKWIVHCYDIGLWG